MEEYIHYFETEAEFNEARSKNYTEPWVSYTEVSDRVDYNKTEDEKLFNTPFTIEALGSGNITWALGDKTVQYSKNGGSWESMDSGTTISVVEWDEVQFKGTNTNYSGNTISTTTQFNVKGNIMSLTDGDEFETADTVNANGFRGLFSGCTYLVSAGNLKLPSTTLASYCYSSMFRNCTGLTTAPELPAMTLVEACYANMFQGCTNLTTAPELPATTLATYSYSYMFRGCTGLTTAPAISATTLAEYCCSNMFQDCTSLTTAPELPATTLATRCYYYMFRDCTGLTTAPEELPATTLASSCYNYMFQGCTSLVSAPKLPATTLVNSCYSNMFNGCTSLTTAPELPATALENYCYQSMFSGCTNLAYIKAMFTTIPGSVYTSNWVSGVAASGTFVKNSAATWTTTGVNGIPTGWTVQTASS